VGGDGLAGADGVAAFVGGGFDADVVGGDLEGGGEEGFHGGDVGGEFGAFGEEGDVGVADFVAAGGGFVEGAAEDFLGVHAAAAGVGVGEEVADVGEGEGAEDGVGEGVGEDVGVGVAVEAEVAGDGDAAEDEFTAGDEAVDVVAEADAEGEHGEIKNLELRIQNSKGKREEIIHRFRRLAQI